MKSSERQPWWPQFLADYATGAASLAALSVRYGFALRRMQVRLQRMRIARRQLPDGASLYRAYQGTLTWMQDGATQTEVVCTTARTFQQAVVRLARFAQDRPDVHLTEVLDIGKALLP